MPLLRQACRRQDVPEFLAPSLFDAQRQRCFSTTPQTKSRIGRSAIPLPPDVSLRFYDLPNPDLKSRKLDTPRSAVEITGPLGQLTLKYAQYLVLNHDEESKKLSVNVQDALQAHQRAMWGTMRAHLQNYVTGVSEGHVCILRMVGVGYRGSVEKTATTTKAEYPGQEFLALKLGFAHPVEMGIPKGVKCSVPQPTLVLLEGPDKEVVTMFAAQIREWRKPEPYKGKGIYINDETIKLKSKKIK